MIVIKDKHALDCMRVSGRLAAEVRDSVAREIAPGVSTSELNDHAVDLISQAGAKSAFLGYRGYPGHICVSINDTVVHGIPGPRRIQLGDIVSIDVGVEYAGYIGDTATTVMVGVTEQEIIRLVTTTERSLSEGIAKARAGMWLNDVSGSIEDVAKEAGYSVVRDFVGHGIGSDMHEEPQIPNFRQSRKGPKLKLGMTLAIEPMVNMGSAGVELQDDGWTVLTKDRLPSAHFEHTVAVRDGEAEILTVA